MTVKTKRTDLSEGLNDFKNFKASDIPDYIKECRMDDNYFLSDEAVECPCCHEKILHPYIRKSDNVLLWEDQGLCEDLECDWDFSAKSIIDDLLRHFDSLFSSLNECKDQRLKLEFRKVINNIFKNMQRQDAGID